MRPYDFCSIYMMAPKFNLKRPTDLLECVKLWWITDICQINKEWGNSIIGVWCVLISIVDLLI